MRAHFKSQTKSTRAVLTATLAFATFAGCRQTPKPLTPVQEEEEFKAMLENSHEPPHNFATALDAKTEALWEEAFKAGDANLRRENLDPDLVRKIGPKQCFTMGCMRKLEFTSRAAATIFEDKVLMGPISPLQSWFGRIYRGPIIDEGGGNVRTIWGLVLETNQYKQLEALSMAPHIVPIDGTTVKRAVSDLRQGDQQ